MDVTPLITSDRMVIQSAGPSGIRISGTLYEHDVIVYPDRVEKLASKDDIYNIISTLKGKTDIVVLGTGKTLKNDFRKLLKPIGMTIEYSSTEAACRTYNILMADGRRLAAILLLPEEN